MARRFATWLVSLAVMLAATQGLAQQSAISLYFGQMVDDNWQDVVFAPGTLRARDARAFGFGLSREWPLGAGGFLGVEARLLRHFGEQDHWELAAPFYYRTPRPERAVLPSFAVGLGLSHASAVPRTEVLRSGESQRILAHWFLELEFGSAASTARPFLRLHHRSNAFGLFEADGGSNLVLLGLRRDF